MPSAVQLYGKDGSLGVNEFLALLAKEGRAGQEAQPGADGGPLPEMDRASFSALAQKLAAGDQIDRLAALDYESLFSRSDQNGSLTVEAAWSDDGSGGKSLAALRLTLTDRAGAEQVFYVEGDSLVLAGADPVEQPQEGAAPPAAVAGGAGSEGQTEAVASDEVAAKSAWLNLLQAQMNKTESETGGSLMMDAIRKRIQAMIEATQATLEREQQHAEQRDSHQEALKKINTAAESSGGATGLEKTGGKAGRKAAAYGGTAQAALLKAGQASFSRNL